MVCQLVSCGWHGHLARAFVDALARRQLPVRSYCACVQARYEPTVARACKHAPYGAISIRHLCPNGLGEGEHGVDVELFGAGRGGQPQAAHDLVDLGLAEPLLKRT